MTHPLYVLLASLLARALDNPGAPHAEAERTIDIAPPFSTVEHGNWAKTVHLWLEHGPALLERQAPRTCPACGSAQSRFLFVSHDGYRFNECADCGCWFVPRRIDASLYASFFEVCKQARGLADAGFAVRSSDQNLAGDLERIGGYLDLLVPVLPAGGTRRYLDIGAGTGSSLLAAQARGLEAVGVEATPRAFEAAAKRGVRMLDAAGGIPPGPHGLISLWETLEHLDDPLGALRESAVALAPRGLLAVTVPNLDSLPARIMRGDCSFIGGGSDGPGHVNLFGSRQLERLFTQAGLSLIYLDGQYSANMLEVVSYLLGRHRGAADLLRDGRIQCHLPGALVDMLISLGPTFALLERQTLLSPILLAVACRKADRPAMQSVADALQAKREKDIAEAIGKLGITPDNRGVVESLQQEVGIANRKLADLQAAAREMESDLRFLRAKHPLAAMILRKLRSLRRANQK